MKIEDITRADVEKLFSSPGLKKMFFEGAEEPREDTIAAMLDFAIKAQGDDQNAQESHEKAAKMAGYLAVYPDWKKICDDCVNRKFTLTKLRQSGNHLPAPKAMHFQNALAHAEEDRRKYVKRLQRWELLTGGIKGTDPQEIYNNLKKYGAALYDPEQDLTPIGGQLENYYQSLGSGQRKLIGIPSGIVPLDNATLGLAGVIILGGNPGAGKTTLALQIAINTCENKKYQTPVLFYSLEMPTKAVITKIINRLARQKYADILLKGRTYLDKGFDSSNLPPEAFIKEKSGKELFDKAIERLGQINDRFFIRTGGHNEAPINFQNIEVEIETLQQRYGTKQVLAVLDHLQVFNPGDYKDTFDKENKIITGFKDIEKRTGATILIISQQNKAGFDQDDKIQSIKGSVDIVYLADYVFNLALPKKQENKNPKLHNMFTEKQDNEFKTIWFNILKSRYSAPTKFKLQFEGAYSEFSEEKNDTRRKVL